MCFHKVLSSEYPIMVHISILPNLLTPTNYLYIDSVNENLAVNTSYSVLERNASNIHYKVLVSEVEIEPSLHSVKL